MASEFDSRFDAFAHPMLDVPGGHSVSIRLRNGSDLSSAFVATFTVQEYESFGFETGPSIKIKFRDYLLPLADCVIDGSPVVPSVGMFIIEGSDEREILPPGGDMPAVELDEGGYRYLAHTKEVT